MTRKLIDYLAKRKKHWQLNCDDDRLISITCSECRITPESIKLAIYDFMNEYGLEFITEEGCPIAGISIASGDDLKHFLQATIHNKGFATVVVEPH